MMRAVVCPRAPINPTGLVYTNHHPKPHPTLDRVLIRVRAYGLNRSELFTRQGHSPGISFPRVLGIECVGEVEDTGGREEWKPGDAVAAILGGMGRQFDGGYAEFALVPYTSVSPPIAIPDGMTWAQFAAIPETHLTAWGTLSESLKLSENDTLLIRGGTTSVGLAAASLAKSSLFNCKRVISTTRSQSKVSVVRECGADDVIIDAGSVKEEVHQLTNGQGVSKCVELVGAPTLADSCAALNSDGVISMIGCVSGEWVCKEFDPMAALAQRKHLTMFSSETINMSTVPVQFIVDSVAKGNLKAGIDKIFKMENTGEAHAYMEANKAAGKVVCVVD